MGLGGYLASITDRDHYDAEERREHEEVIEKPEAEKQECYAILEKYGMTRDVTGPMIEKLALNKDMWVQVRFNPRVRFLG